MCCIRGLRGRVLQIWPVRHRLDGILSEQLWAQQRVLKRIDLWDVDQRHRAGDGVCLQEGHLCIDTPSDATSYGQVHTVHQTNRRDKALNDANKRRETKDGTEVGSERVGASPERDHMGRACRINGLDGEELFFFSNVMDTFANGPRVAAVTGPEDPQRPTTLCERHTCDFNGGLAGVCT